jgi:hypothetical protein
MWRDKIKNYKIRKDDYYGSLSIKKLRGLVR